MSKSKENLTIASLVGITGLVGILLTLPSVSAETEAVDTVTITVPSACSMTPTVGTTHTASVDSGTYVADIGETTLKTICNDSNGFSIYAIGYTDDTYGNTKLKSSVGATSDVDTGIATSGNTSNWAMKLTAGTGTYAPTIETDTNGSFANYHVIPESYTKVATFASTTDATNGSTLTTTYAVYMNATQPAGTYEGKVKYTLVHPASETPLQPQTATSGCINYFANASDAVGTMGCQSVSASATSATLLASNFSRSGYGFAGWSDKFDYATNPNAKFYGPQEDITFTAGQYTGTNNGLALYAVWVKSQGSLQDASKVSSVCSALTTAPTNGTANLASVSALTDQRDNQTYAIAKLADGKCWMIENLRLESTASHNSDGTLAQGYNSSFAGLANAESANFTDSTTANSLYSTDGSTTKTIYSTDGIPGYRFPRYNNTNTQSRAQNNPNTNSFSENNTDGGMYSYGNYYTWHAAIADTTYNDTNNNSSDTTSICPKGWRLPHGGQTTVNTTAEFYLLGKAIMNNIEPDASNGFVYYGDSVTNTAGKTATAAFRSYPNNFIYSGNFNASSVVSRGSRGYYWSSTVSDYYTSYYLSLYISLVLPGTYGLSKCNGLSIRCVSGS